MKAKVYGTFSKRENLTEAETELSTSHGVSFICDKQGNDWYDLQKDFKSNTLKVVFELDGIITTASYDVSALWPMSASVAEVDAVPDTFDVSSLAGRWVFENGQITERIYTPAELITQANAILSGLMADAMLKIAPLQDALDIGDATEEELTLLKAWKTYRVLLNRLDLSTAPDIIWPEIPA